MNRIEKLNYSGIAAGFAMLTFSISLSTIVGCAPSAGVRAAPYLNSAAYAPLNPSYFPQNGQLQSDLSSLPMDQQNQVTALMGTYSGTFWAENEDGDDFQQSYTLTLSKTPSTSAPGKTFVQAQFAAGAQFSFTSLMQVSYIPTVYQDAGPTYTFVSAGSNIPAFSEYSKVYLVLQLTLNAMNQFDPTQSVNNLTNLGPIAIVDGVSFKAIPKFNFDFRK